MLAAVNATSNSTSGATSAGSPNASATVPEPLVVNVINTKARGNNGSGSVTTTAVYSGSQLIANSTFPEPHTVADRPRTVRRALTQLGQRVTFSGTLSTQRFIISADSGKLAGLC
jgi:hypothetical protein